MARSADNSNDCLTNFLLLTKHKAQSRKGGNVLMNLSDYWPAHR